MTEDRLFLQKNRKRIEEAYAGQKEILPEVFEEIDKKISLLDEDTALALEYLYAFMPMSDIGNYEFENFLDYAKNGVSLWREIARVRKLPEEIFLNYVLFHRVNEEEISPCRSFFRREITDLTREMDFKRAALEVNYWCASKATYHCADERTLSAMAVYESGLGRCGEESVFAVNALRSIGVPARQVYAPRWSHCDDNHAWVEIWDDGEWYFMGACEPEAVLNKGWFTGAASRAMMIHSRVFDTRIPEGEVIGKEGMVTMLNELKRYAPVKTLKVQVRDQSGNPVPNALVLFEVMNYAEYVPVAEKYTDSKGETVLTTGLGSLHIQAGYQKDGSWHVSGRTVHVEEADFVSICPDDPMPENEWIPADLYAPSDAPLYKDCLTEEQAEEARKRLSMAAKQREEKTRGWENPELLHFLNKEVTGMEAAADYAFREKMLSVLTEKDRCDCKDEVLQEHLRYAVPFHGMMKEETFVSYVLNPRVHHEVMQKYRKRIKHDFSKEEKKVLRENPRKIWELIDRYIVSRPEKERASVMTTPAGCLKTHTGSGLSKKILFVAAARTFGIPARLNPEDLSMEYMRQGKFVPVLPSEKKDARLILKGEGWKYLENWTLGKFENDRYQTLNLQETAFSAGQCVLNLTAGRYRLLTANRLPNGNLFSAEYDFSLYSDEEKEILMLLREANLKDMLEEIALPDFSLKTEEDQTVKASDLIKNEKHILMFLEAEKEPTEHILNEMMEHSEEFLNYEKNIIFVVKTKQDPDTPTLNTVLKRFPGIRVFYDDFKELPNILGRRMYVNPDRLPLIIVTDGGLKGIYGESGYNVGTGEMLLRLL